MRHSAALSALRRVVAAARWLFGPIAIVFLLAAGWHSREVFQTVISQTDAIPIVLAIALWSSLHLLSPVFSWIVLHDAGVRIDYGCLLNIHVGRLPARYLPGGIWHTVSRVVDLHEKGVTRSQLSLMLLLENILPIGVALTLGGLCLRTAGNTSWPAVSAIAIGPTILLSGYLMVRRIFPTKLPRVSPSAYLKSVAVTFAFWTGAATAFFLYWSAFPAARFSLPTLEIYGVYLVSWVAGFITIFAPQGIGVFESVAGLLLRTSMTFGGAAILVAGFRVAVLLADMLAFGVLLCARHTPRFCFRKER